MRLNIEKLARAFVAIFVFGMIGQAMAQDFQYFEKQIDFWNEKAAPSSSPTTETVKPSKLGTQQTQTEAQTDGPFPWAKYLDPKNKEFFKEGDYTPPEPFMEIVRNPSDQNLKLWFAYMDKKNELSNRLQTRMQEFMQRKGLTIEPQAREAVTARLAALPRSEPEAKRYRFRMYFDSHCPHCKRMFSTMAELQNRGFFVEGLQVDGQSGTPLQLSFPTTFARPADIKDKDIQSVPILLVGDMKKKVVFKLNGYQSIGDVFSAISTAEAKP